MLEQRLDLALIIGHFTDSDETFMLDNRGLPFVLTRSHKERYCHMENFLHLGQNKADLVLQQGTASVEVFWNECLADGNAGLFSVDVSQSEHGTIPLEEGMVGTVQHHLRQVAHI